MEKHSWGEHLAGMCEASAFTPPPGKQAGKQTNRHKENQTRQLNYQCQSENSDGFCVLVSALNYLIFQGERVGLGEDRWKPERSHTINPQL